MSDMKRIAAVIGAALVAPLLLTGCVTTESYERAVPPALTASDDRISRASATAHKGLSGVRLTVQLWVNTTNQRELAEVLDNALRTSIAASPARPIGVTMYIAEAGSSGVGRHGIDFTAAAQRIGVYDRYSDRGVNGHISHWEERYGTWEDLHREWREAQE